MWPAGRYERGMLGHMQMLLVLRVLATLVVVVGHAASFFDALPFTQWPNAPYMQSMAVTLFFAISGFTIAWVVDRSQGVGAAGLVRFVYDRFLRLAIPLLPTLLLFLVVEHALLVQHPYQHNTSLVALVGNALFLQNLVPGVAPFGLNRPLWTISLEFWVYVAFGAVAFAFKAKQITALSAITLALAVWLLLPFLWSGRGLGLPLVWIGGAGLYFALRHRPISRDMKLAAALGFLICCKLLATPALWPNGGEYSQAYNALIFLAFAAFMICHQMYKLPSRVMRVVEVFGGFAYTLYLTHYPTMYLLDNYWRIGDGHPALLAACLLCVAFAYAWSWPFERQYRHIRHYLWNKLHLKRFALG